MAIWRSSYFIGPSRADQNASSTKLSSAPKTKQLDHGGCSPIGMQYTKIVRHTMNDCIFAASAKDRFDFEDAQYGS